jgi:hypothetical protein
MVTRLYLPSTGASPVTVTPTVWTKNTGHTQLKIGRAKISSAMSTLSNARGVSTNPMTVINVSYVSDPLSAQTLGGTLKGQIRAAASNALLTGNLSIAARVVKNDGTDYASPKHIFSTPVHSSNATYKYTTTIRNWGFMTAADAFSLTVPAVTVVEGDRLVVEIGYYSADTSTTRNGQLSVGDNSATDLTEQGSETTANNPWVEFSQTINFISSLNKHPYLTLDQQNGTDVTGTTAGFHLVNSTTISSDTTKASHGDRSLKVHCPGNASGEGGEIQNIPGGVINQAYSSYLRMWVPTGTTINVHFGDSAYAYVGTAVNVVGNSAWQTVRVQNMSSATLIMSRLIFVNTATTLVDFWVDDININAGATAVDWGSDKVIGQSNVTGALKSTTNLNHDYYLTPNQKTGGDTGGNTTGFSSLNSATISRDTTKAHDGTGCIKAHCPGNAYAEGVNIQMATTCLVNTDYTVEFWFWGTNGEQYDIHMANSSWAYASPGGPYTGTGAWQKITIPFNHATVKADRIIVIPNGQSAAEDIWVDSFSFTTGATAHPYNSEVAVGQSGSTGTLTVTGAGTTYSVAGTVTATSNVPNSAVKTTRKLASTSTGLSGGSGLAKMIWRPKASASAAVSTTPNALLSRVTKVASVGNACASSASGFLKRTMTFPTMTHIAANSNVPLTPIKVERKVAGTLAGLSNVPNSKIIRAFRGQGTVTALSGFSAQCEVLRIYWGTVSAASTVTGSLTGNFRLAGVSAGHSNVPNALLSRAYKIIGQVITGISGFANTTLKTIVPVKGNVVANSNVPNTKLRVIWGAKLIANGNISTAQAKIIRMFRGQGTLSAISTGNASMTGVFLIKGTSIAQSNVTAKIIRIFSITGVSEAHSVVTALLKYIFKEAGTVSGSSSTYGKPSVTRGFKSTVTATSDASASIIRMFGVKGRVDAVSELIPVFPYLTRNISGQSNAVSGFNAYTIHGFVKMAGIIEAISSSYGMIRMGKVPLIINLNFTPIKTAKIKFKLKTAKVQFKIKTASINFVLKKKE